ncbi:hypothetical protein [Caproicibacterium lactatifermentans]|jgi:hypothetical protein|uniref:Cxxc_20_cxxc protein n=1 Tax=Caproicibacterium lactatifermentans TaxID=2666138 RepID=A0A859DN91_9FIRM|nr:hypothetical protein [Caproicibacterium lactatifermentans]ARP49417.1 hypothetical protein B6259_00040 [Ruminococcaceae bacterium CPB6]MDD4807233.1 hypothetical protein [Oscillospiraceae bacterium]QKN23009.1 hypothetical protein GJQ69_00040 [Caproicibacterium lactatifermentans]QKO30385.1 hypothetical protein GKP14_04740 [Caproicibacterium lactatifermentans]
MKTRKQASCCPWCGAHYTQMERCRAARKSGHLQCPVCGRLIHAFRSGKRMAAFISLTVAMCVCDFFLLQAGVPLVGIWVLTAALATVLWCFRGWTVVFEKSPS